MHVTSGNATSEFQGHELSSISRTFFLTVGTIMVLSGLFGNLLVLSTLIFSPNIASVHNVLLINMSLADLVITGYWLPFFVLDLFLGYMPVVGMEHCVFNGVLDVTFEVVSFA